jgi:hypothetical protein
MVRVHTGRVVEVIIRCFGYHVLNITEQGAVLVTNEQPRPVIIPLGVDDLDEEIINHLISRASFTVEAFWTEANQSE